MKSEDKIIEDALIAEEQALLASIGDEPPYLQQLLSIFSGRTGWVNMVMLVAQTVLFIAGMWAGWHFFAAVDVLAAIKWGLSATMLILMSLMTKLALWPVVYLRQLGVRLDQIALQLRQ